MSPRGDRKSASYTTAGAPKADTDYRSTYVTQVRRVDVAHTVYAIQTALMHVTYADVARHPIWLRGRAFADGNAGGA
ncbi:hypothetical protein [Candidatus Nitrotoga sp. 1052]|uniref:hypothetical protein n=1 Tax=Candidatus Nitrotoga sp. 1052 TaxID=2886964 RepID=UPI001EF70F2B|nr:hypothetical protein [Candidatus Nitrotoga sp. 1052]